jgi:hypothetical protein
MLWRTPGQKRKNYADRLQELNRLGLAAPLEYSLVSNQATEIMVEQAAAEIECPITDLQDGRTLYVVWLSLVPERPGVTLFDFRFFPPWSDCGFTSLPSFEDSHEGRAYILPGGLAFPREHVLNLHFLKSGWRLPCTRVEGVIAALSNTPIPKHYEHGDTIPIGVEFFGRSGRQLGVRRDKPACCRG